MTAARRMRSYRSRNRLRRELERARRAGVDVRAIVEAWFRELEQLEPRSESVTAIAVTP